MDFNNQYSLSNMYNNPYSYNNNLDMSSITNTSGSTDSIGSLFNSGFGNTATNPSTGLTLDDLGGIPGILGIVQGLGGLFNNYNLNNQAKDNLKFQKQAYGTNLRNQTQAYNTNLEDRIKARYAQENRSQEEATNYINRNRL